MLIDRQVRVTKRFDPDAQAVVFEGNCLDLMPQIPDGTVQLVVTSPPYNIGKPYEQKLDLDDYVAQQEEVISECARVLRDDGHICWQVGNHVNQREIVPLDAILYPVFAKLGFHLRNRIVWHFEHGLHCTRRFSGRYETINWFTRNNHYYFDVDPIRVPQKYPGKRHFKGPNAGKPSANPLGKNPGDVWVFPNVKSNHVEKTEHPCQFPIELVERLILSMTHEDDWVLDPFLGSGTTVAASILNNRRGMGAEIDGKYVVIARDRIRAAANGTLRFRPRSKPVFDPANAGRKITTPPWTAQPASKPSLFDND
jgi:adenine-specific DNA-methyltransferase